MLPCLSSGDCRLRLPYAVGLGGNMTVYHSFAAISCLLNYGLSVLLFSWKAKASLVCVDYLSLYI